MKDKITTLFGALAGVAVLLSSMWQEYEPLLRAISGLAIVVLGYFTNKPSEEV